MTRQEEQERLSIMRLLDSKAVGNLCLLFVVITITPFMSWWFVRSISEASRQTEILRQIQGSNDTRNEALLKVIGQEDENRKLNELQVKSLETVVASQAKIIESNLKAQDTVQANFKITAEDHRKMLEKLCGPPAKDETDKAVPPVPPPHT